MPTSELSHRLRTNMHNLIVLSRGQRYLALGVAKTLAKRGFVTMTDTHQVSGFDGGRASYQALCTVTPDGKAALASQPGRGARGAPKRPCDQPSPVDHYLAGFEVLGFESDAA